MNLTSAAEPLPPVRMYYNPPSPLPRQGLHHVTLRFGDDDRLETVHVERGSVTYFTKSTNWTWTDDDRAAQPEFSRRVEQVAPKLAAAIRELQQAPQGGDVDGQQNNNYAIRLGAFPGPEQGYTGQFIGGRDAGDAVAMLLRDLADDAKGTLPSYTRGPG